METRVRQGRAPQVKLPPKISWTLLGLMRYRQRMHEAVQELQEAHPDYDDGAGVTDPYMYRVKGGCDHVLRQEMLKLTDLVNKARDTVIKTAS